jgi:hypothetical protein
MIHLPSQRQMRLNIWHALLSASDTEITEGMSFYDGAHGICRMISRLTNDRVSVSHVAGIYAALSPMNGWEENVANIFSVIREQDSCTVNTSHPNRLKALRIYHGEDPLQVLRGRKVTAFYHSIAGPLNHQHIPIDRHLINLAMGWKLGKNDLSRAASSRELYDRIEKVYQDLGAREQLGNRLASIAWFVQRRAESGQAIIPHHLSPVCCLKPMQSQGQKPRRFLCSTCGRSKVIRLDITNLKTKIRISRPPIAILDGFPITQHRDPVTKRLGRKIIRLGKDHLFANGAGWQYLSRYLVMKELDERLRSDEHVDHKDLDKTNDTLDNLRVMLAERHGKHHVYLAELAGGRGEDGRFRKYDQPITHGEPDYPDDSLASLEDIPF